MSASKEGAILIDLQAGSQQTLTRTDAFLLLLAVQDHLSFREEWKTWSDDPMFTLGDFARASRSIQRAMWRLRCTGPLLEKTEEARQ